MKLILAILAALLVSPASAQVKQSGYVTPGHVVYWVTNGVVGDGGTAANGFLTSLGVTASGPGICQNSGSPAAGGYNQLCFAPTNTGGGFTWNNYNGATGVPSMNINGTVYPFPFSVSPGGVIGPSTTTIGCAAPWANTVGTLLANNCALSISGNAVTAASAGPIWTTYATYNAGLTYGLIGNVGSFPAGSLPGANTIAFTGSITGLLDIPSSSNNTNAPAGAGLVGMARTANSQQNAVGVYGMGLLNSGGLSAWGANFGVDNTPFPGNLAANNQHDQGFTCDCYGLEINPGIFLTSVGGTPDGNVRGIWIVGAGETLVSGGNYAINVDSPGYLQLPKLLWNSIIRSEDGSATLFADIGAMSVSNGVASQPISLRSRTSGGTNNVSTIQADANGNVLIEATTGTAVSLGDIGNGPVVSFSRASNGMYPNTSGTVGLATVPFANVFSDAYALFGSSTGYTTLASANAGVSNYTLTLPAITDTLVSLTATQTLTNKTLTTPITTGYAISGLPGSCTAGMRAHVTNGVASPTFGGTVSTTGSTVDPVFCIGSSWVYG